MERRIFAAALASGALAVPGLARAQAATMPTIWESVMTQRKTLRIGAAILEPWYLKDDSGSSAPGAVVVDGVTWRGICPSLGKAVADAMGVKLQIVETTWGNAVAALQADQMDCMFGLDPTPMRALVVDFVPDPILWYPGCALVRENVSFTSWSDLNDPKWKVAVALGTNFDEYLKANCPRATITRYQNSGETFAAFQAGRADAVITSATAADIARARLKMGKVIVPKPEMLNAAGAAMRLDADHRFRDYLNIVCSYLYRTGKTQHFYEEFLAFRNIDPKSAISVMRETWPR